MSTQLIFSQNPETGLTQLLSAYKADQIFVLTDTTTEQLCLPEFKEYSCLKTAKYLTIPAGDGNKNVESLSKIWMFLSKNGATRKSVLINIGGGMITDIGGFAAASFKRGIDCINIPTTILSAVDAAVGGKTGINFNELKNEIGAFHQPKAVIFYSGFYKTLDKENILSGFAEMLKHGLLSDTDYLNSLLSLDLTHPESSDFDKAIERSVVIKRDIVIADPKENGIRKALNLGHTVGHAFESFSHHSGRPVLHGFAIAWGLICELYLSKKQLNFPENQINQIVTFVKQNYGLFEIKPSDYDYLINAMTHDKKNVDKNINFTLLSDVGEIKLDQTADESLIISMLDYYRSL